MTDKIKLTVDSNSDDEADGEYENKALMVCAGWFSIAGVQFRRVSTNHFIAC